MEPRDTMGPQTHGGFCNFLRFAAQCIQLIQIISIGSKDCFFHEKFCVNNRFWCPLAWIYHLNPLSPPFISKTLLPSKFDCIIAWLLGILNVAGSIMKFCSLVGAHSHFRHDSHGNMEWPKCNNTREEHTQQAVTLSTNNNKNNKMEKQKDLQSQSLSPCILLKTPFFWPCEARTWKLPFKHLDEKH